MNGSIHKIHGYRLQYFDFGRIKITEPNGKELWTNSFKIVREQFKEDVQTKLEL